MRRGSGTESDHHLVTAYLKLKLKSAGRLTKGRSRFDVSQLKHPNVRKSFILEVHNRLEALVELGGREDINDEGVNKNWEKMLLLTMIAARHV